MSVYMISRKCVYFIYECIGVCILNMYALMYLSVYIICMYLSVYIKYMNVSVCVH
jgi:hypothetical protein